MKESVERIIKLFKRKFSVDNCKQDVDHTVCNILIQNCRVNVLLILVLLQKISFNFLQRVGLRDCILQGKRFPNNSILVFLPTEQIIVNVMFMQRAPAFSILLLQ